ncbi:MAG TPA: CpsB/CapC family capsule biosynthesis tyrosine phosphatase [Bryobacteraceae bacterium]|jgi:protein-tyrosine phosphatase
MIDIHSHILWGLDDGSSSLEESIDMLQVARKCGTTDIVATPHLNARYAFQPEAMGRAIEELTTRMEGQPVIHRGCEFQINSDNLDALLECPSTYTINGGPYLLLESHDFHIGKYTESILDRLLSAGVTPIIAHPERNQVILSDLNRLEAWVQSGCLVQITALSITGGFGSPPKSACTRLLNRGLVHIVASDAHDPQRRSPDMSPAYKALSGSLGTDAADLLFTENPQCVVEGRPVLGDKLMLKAASKKRWWPF